MDTATIAGAALIMKSANTQQTMSVSMMKQAADQQNKMANLLAQNVQQAAQSGYNFSTYA